MLARVNWFYGLVAILFVAMLYISAKYFKGSENSAVGIAQAKEYKINSEKSSLIKTIKVVPGQQVRSGDLLIELTSSDLEMDIEKLTNRLIVMKAEQIAKSKMVASEAAYIRAGEGVRQEELSSEIEQTKSEVQLNRALTRSFVTDTTTMNDGPLQVKIHSLQAQQRQHKQSIDIRIQDMEKKNDLEQVQLTNQIRLLEQELGLLQQEQKKLSKYAVADGVIENVYIKEGEEVSAFTPLLSVTPLRPTTVIAFLVGSKHTDIGVGSSVTVKAYGIASSLPVEGKVIGFGSVAELPEILQKSTAVKAFGREVFIEISGDNDLANGQKVLIR